MEETGKYPLPLGQLSQLFLGHFSKLSFSIIIQRACNRSEPTFAHSHLLMLSVRERRRCDEWDDATSLAVGLLFAFGTSSSLVLCGARDSRLLQGALWRDFD